jgi:twinkle protein
MAFIKTKLPCPSCKSSDAYAIDDNGWGKCFSCDVNIKLDSPLEGSEESYIVTDRIVPDAVRKHLAKPDLEYKALVDIVYRAIPDRKILVGTAERFGVGFKDSDLIFPYGANAAKVRIRSDKAQQTIRGDWGSYTGLFGQDKFPAGGKRILITEGEFDALAAWQMLSGKYPAVSVKTGSKGALKDCKANYEYLDSFEDIYICFDSDAPGLEASAEVAELFARKAKVVKFPNGFKDANDMLMEGKSKDFIECFWRAEQYVPDGIVAGSSMYESVMTPRKGSDVSYPWSGLNKLTYGIRKGELVTITAGSGLGKSQFAKEIAWHIIQHTPDRIGLMFMEEATDDTGRGLMSLAVNKPLHLPDCNVSQEEKDAAYAATLGTDKLFLFKHFGSNSINTIVDRVRFMAKGLDCGYIFLDHLSIIVSAQSNGDERKAIDEIMTKLRTLVQETGISLFCVSHLKRPESKGHEEGAVTSLSQLRGSASIAQLSDMVISLERNGQHDDAIKRNTTKTRVLKNRFCGTTGAAGSLLYSLDTGRMMEYIEEEDEPL